MLSVIVFWKKFSTYPFLRVLPFEQSIIDFYRVCELIFENVKLYVYQHYIIADSSKHFLVQEFFIQCRILKLCVAAFYFSTLFSDTQVNSFFKIIVLFVQDFGCQNFQEMKTQPSSLHLQATFVSRCFPYSSFEF